MVRGIFALIVVMAAVACAAPPRRESTAPDLREGGREARRSIAKQWEDLHRRVAEEDGRDLVLFWPPVDDIFATFDENKRTTISIDAVLMPREAADLCADRVAAFAIEHPGYAGVDLRTDRALSRSVDEEGCFGRAVLGNAERAVPLRGASMLVGGTASIVADRLSGTVVLAGELGVALAGTGDGAHAGAVISGYIDLRSRVPFVPPVVRLTVVPDPLNMIRLGADGVGEGVVLLTAEYASDMWGALLPYYVRLPIPMALAPGGRIDVTSGPALSSRLFFPYVPRLSEVSDFNDDGELDFESDRAAFLAALREHDYIADHNSDGVWDETDAELWAADFTEELEYLSRVGVPNGRETP